MGDYKIFFQNHLKGLASRLMTHPRRWYHKKKAKNCKKEKCSIICNNCTGGVILHDLGLRFDTPTINTLFYNADDFLFFVSNIKAFSKSDMYQIPDTNYSYPIGAIKLRERIIKIGLVHYSTFDEGKRKWEERFKRIQYPKQVYSLDCEDFSKLYPFYVGHIIYRSWFPGKIIEYKHLLSLKRYLDDFNYIKFLNVHSV